MNDPLLALIVAGLWLWTPLAFAASAVGTLAHAAEETFGDGGPLWREFGRVAGVRVPGPLGFFAVAVALPAALVAAAYAGYVRGDAVALSALFGAKVGDAACSHWLPCFFGLIRPNPGITTSVLAAAEGLVGAALFGVDWPVALAAAGGFALVVPALRLFRFRQAPAFPIGRRGREPQRQQ